MAIGWIIKKQLAIRSSQSANLLTSIGARFADERACTGPWECFWDRFEYGKEDCEGVAQAILGMAEFRVQLNNEEIWFNE